MNSYELQTTSSGDAILVVSQIYYPGWKATVDGVAVPVYPADAGITALGIPGGTHEVRLFFRPATFQIGGLISLLSVAAGALLFVMNAKKGIV